MRSEKVTNLSPKTIFLAVTQVILACLAVGIAVRQVGKQTGSIDLHLLVQGLPWLVGAAVAYVLFYALLAVHWQYITKHIEPSVSKYQWLAFFAAQPYKYLPTSIFTLTFRAKYASKLGMGIKKSSLAQLIENVSMLATATAIAVPVWLAIHNQLVFGVICFFVCLLAFVVGFELLSRVKFGIHFPVRKRLELFFIALSAWTVSGVAFFIVTPGLQEPTGVIEAIGANAAAFEAGILAVFAPGGIGIRELVFGLFSIGALSIIAWRLVTAVVDIIVGPLAWIAIRRVTTEKS